MLMKMFAIGRAVPAYVSGRLRGRRPLWIAGRLRSASRLQAAALLLDRRHDPGGQGVDLGLG